MKDILIVTLFGNFNLGNRLQNYALQFILTHMGYKSYTGKYNVQNRFRENITTYIKRLLLFFNKDKHLCYTNKINLDKKRALIFDEFNDEYIYNVIDIGTFDYKKLKKLEFEFAISGSDQVWHHRYHKKNEMPYFYLSFMPKNKRIAYAPSFGFVDFQTNELLIHKNGLLGFEDGKISIREQHGAYLNKELIGLDVPVVPDPTLLLYRSDWEKIAKKPEYNVPEHFVIQYFLGDAHQYDKGLSVIDIYNPENEKWFTKTGPSEFIWLMQHCEYVCTDSFHACVFSIIFHRDFAVFHRRQNGMEGMFDRIETLLSNTGLEQCIENSDNHEIDWHRVDTEIDRRRKIGIDFLTNALNEDNIK